MSYLQAYKLSSVIKSAFVMALRNFQTFFFIYAIPILPIHIIVLFVVSLAEPSGPEDVVITSAIVAIIVSIVTAFASFPVTVAVSEICLGIQPSVFRCYRRAFSHPGRLIGTMLLYSLIVVLGFIALLVPGLILSTWYAFIGPVVVLEAIGGLKALRRSRELGRGYYFRNFGIMLLMAVIVAVISFTLTQTLEVSASIVRLGEAVLLQPLTSLLSIVPAPLGVIGVVLLYYDMRVRKEGYGTTQLAEDIRF